MFKAHAFPRGQRLNELPDFPPRNELEMPRGLKATTRALAELKGRTHTIPHRTILLHTLALQEAKLSSDEKRSPRAGFEK